MSKPNITSYNVPKQGIEYEDNVKKSRFIVNVGVTPTLGDAKLFIDSVKQKYPDAGHHCWAHVAGAPNGSHVYGFSDDGEPNGTAGKPMLNVLTGSGLGDISAVITRYFGGIKLGTGGLVRAYGGSLNNALQLIEVTEKIPETIILGNSEYGHQMIIEKILSGYIIMDIDKEFSDKIYWRIKMDARSVKTALVEITNATSGNVIFEIED